MKKFNVSRMSYFELIDIIAWDYACSRIPEDENRYGRDCVYEEFARELEMYSREELEWMAVKAILQL